MRDAEERRPPAQLFIERFERHYAKVVVVGSILLAVVPPLVLGWTFRVALYRSMIFLVVASPCALAAAMMPTLLSALSNGARSGVLFKGRLLDFLVRNKVFSETDLRDALLHLEAPGERPCRLRGGACCQGRGRSEGGCRELAQFPMPLNAPTGIQR